jgi:hypothetical protein
MCAACHAHWMLHDLVILIYSVEMPG